MSSESIVGIILSSVTVAVALIAIVISVVQIQKSNKQSLFDRRLKIFLIVNSMKSLCDENKTLKNNYINEPRETPIYAMDFLFIMMTNNSFLEDIQPVANNVLNSEYQRKYLLKMEELKNLCEESRLVFSNRIGFPISDFVFYYREMLVSMYKYLVAIDSITEECQKNKQPFPKNNELENNQRATMITAINNTFILSDRLSKDNILDSLKKQIVL